MFLSSLLLERCFPQGMITPQKSNELIAKIAIFKGSRYLFQDTNHFGALQVSFRGSYSIWSDSCHERLKLKLKPSLQLEVRQLDVDVLDLSSFGDGQRG